MPWPGKMLNSLNAHLSYLTTILRGLFVSCLVSLAPALSLAAAARGGERRACARGGGGGGGGGVEPWLAKLRRRGARLRRRRAAPSPLAAWACHDDLCVRRRPLRPSLAAKDRSGSRTAAVSECCKDSLWLATPATARRVASLRLRSVQMSSSIDSVSHLLTLRRRLGPALFVLAAAIAKCRLKIEPQKSASRVITGSSPQKPPKRPVLPAI